MGDLNAIQEEKSEPSEAKISSKESKIYLFFTIFAILLALIAFGLLIREENDQSLDASEAQMAMVKKNLEDSQWNICTNTAEKKDKLIKEWLLRFKLYHEPLKKGNMSSLEGLMKECQKEVLDVKKIDEQKKSIPVSKSNEE